MTSQAATTKKHEIAIVYNGISETFDYKSKELVEKVRHRALKHFDVRGDGREQVRLFLPDNQTELPDDASMEDAGVQPDMTLILRPRASGGGS